MSKFVSICLYFTSFFPLWISILFIDIKSLSENTNNLWTERISICIILLISFISLLVLQLTFSEKSKEGSTRVVVKNVKTEKTITSEYILS